MILFKTKYVFLTFKLKNLRKTRFGPEDIVFFSSASLSQTSP
jgi:hypothetical protein